MEGPFQTESLKLVVFLILSCTSTIYGHSVESDADDLLYGQNDNVQTRSKRAATAGLVDIALFEDSSAAGKLHMVFVDDTMTRLIFQVTVYHSNPVIMATTPSKIPYTQHPTMTGDPALNDGKVVATLNIPINRTDFGFWTFTKLDSSKWYVNIQAESPVSINHQLFELGTNTPINGHPIQGCSYRLVVTVTGVSNIRSGYMAFLFTRQRVSPISMVTLTDTGNGAFEAARVKMPSEVFMFVLQGKDNSNNLFRRLDVTEIVPVTVELTVPAYRVTHETVPVLGAIMTEYSTFNISFIVTNLLHTSQEIDVRIEDSRGYAQAPKFLSSTLKVGENFTGIFVLQAYSAGIVTSVKIVARQYLGNGSYSSGPEEIRNFTVMPQPTTPTTTTIMTTTTSSTMPATTPVPSTSVSPITSLSPRAPQATPKSKNSLTIDVNTLDAGADQSPDLSDGQRTMQKAKDSLLLMFLTMSDSDDKSIRINADL